jgi:hypothetical protein
MELFDSFGLKGAKVVGVSYLELNDTQPIGSKTGNVKMDGVTARSCAAKESCKSR